MQTQATNESATIPTTVLRRWIIKAAALGLGLGMVAAYAALQAP